MGDHVNLIEECIGYEAMSSLAGWTGGIELYIPSASAGDQYAALVARIGATAAGKLVAWAGGSRIYIPMLFQVELMRRRDEVIEMRGRGKTLHEISREYRYTGRYSQRNIQRLLEMRDDDILRIADDGAQLSIL